MDACASCHSPGSKAESARELLLRVVPSCTAALAANARTGECTRASARRQLNFDSSLLLPLQEQETPKHKSTLVLAMPTGTELQKTQRLLHHGSAVLQRRVMQMRRITWAYATLRVKGSARMQSRLYRGYRRAAEAGSIASSVQLGIALL